MIDDQAKLKELEREIKMRGRVYPRLVADGKVSQRFADERILIMQAIADDYRSKIQPSLPLLENKDG